MFRRSMKFLVLELVFVFAGCSMDPIGYPELDSGSAVLDVDGSDRTFEYRLPDDASTMVIALHGGGDKVSTFEDYSKLTAEVNSTQRFGVVYPEGINKHWNDGRAEDGSDADDVGFIDEIITYYKNRSYDKFYIVGMSNGGVMAQRAACELSTKISGIAVVAATQTTVLESACPDTRPLPAMFVFGSEDTAFLDNGDIVNPLVPSQLRGTHIGITATLDYWQRRNICYNGLIKDTTLNSEDDHTSIDLYNTGLCSANVRYYDVIGGGHRWPDPDSTAWIPSIGYASHEISTAKEIVNFFGL